MKIDNEFIQGLKALDAEVKPGDFSFTQFCEYCRVISMPQLCTAQEYKKMLKIGLDNWLMD